MLWRDLRAEPLVFSVPALETKRYYSVQLVDGNTFNYGDAGSRATGMKEGEKKCEAKVASMGKEINGWRVGSAFGDRDFYHGDWLLRAAAAKAGIYGNDAVEAMYPMTRKDSSGETLDGSKHNYTLTFAKDQFPPVNAFWSVTMYDGKTQLLIETPISRYLINSPMLPTHCGPAPAEPVTSYW